MRWRDSHPCQRRLHLRVLQCAASHARSSPPAAGPLCRSQISFVTTGPNEAGVPIARQPTFEDLEGLLRQTPPAQGQHQRGAAAQRAAARRAAAQRASVFSGWLSTLRARVFALSCFSPSTWRRLNALAGWVLFPLLVVAYLWLAHTFSARPPPPAELLQSEASEVSWLTRLTIDGADGISSVAGAAVFISISPGIRLRASGNCCVDLVTQGVACLRLGAIFLLIFAAGFGVGNVLSVLWDVHWDVHELTILACDAVVGWHAMRWAVEQCSGGTIIVEGVHFGRGGGTTGLL